MILELNKQRFVGKPAGTPGSNSAMFAYSGKIFAKAVSTANNVRDFGRFIKAAGGTAEHDNEWVLGAVSQVLNICNIRARGADSLP